MDMRGPYIAAVKATVPEAEEKICFDKYHVASHLGEAVDKVRRQEHRELLAEGDETLKGPKQMWLRNPENTTRKQWREFGVVRSQVVRTSRAWALKGRFRKSCGSRVGLPGRDSGRHSGSRWRCGTSRGCGTRRRVA